MQDDKIDPFLVQINIEIDTKIFRSVRKFKGSKVNQGIKSGPGPAPMQFLAPLIELLMHHLMLKAHEVVK